MVGPGIGFFAIAASLVVIAAILGISIVLSLVRPPKPAAVPSGS
ncbi:MAG TPA: hypothetical protein PLB01_10750 [Thermoanaerobaculia bacterium]|nr:hypothetical protein [Thermoanaerobaculia bacterium]